MCYPFIILKKKEAKMAKVIFGDMESVLNVQKVVDSKDGTLRLQMSGKQFKEQVEAIVEEEDKEKLSTLISEGDIVSMFIADKESIIVIGEID